MLLKDRVVIITGVGPGMGRKLALLCAAEGAKVAASARSVDFLRDVVAEIEAAGGQAIAVPTDVSQDDQCDRLAAATLEAFGRIDGLVNSAYHPGAFVPFEDGDLAEWQNVMNVTHFGALRMARAVIPAMKSQGAGAIVNVSTRSSIYVVPGHGDYGTAKAAMNAATRQLAGELGKYGIRVNATRMGWMWGAPVEGALEQRAKTRGVSPDVVKAEVVARIPIGRIPTDEECARAVVFLLSDYSSAITGVALDVNGGEVMPL
jgi:NAD(P)-dependent dehydrogenase (short-subunit alcohol dehydrogenase family)